MRHANTRAPVNTSSQHTVNIWHYVSAIINLVLISADYSGEYEYIDMYSARSFASANDRFGLVTVMPLKRRQ
jgi:hypothetical protein